MRPSPTNHDADSDGDHAANTNQHSNALSDDISHTRISHTNVLTCTNNNANRHAPPAFSHANGSPTLWLAVLAQRRRFPGHCR